MEGNARLKVQGGKLLAASVVYADTLQKVRLTGDFFVYPSEGIYTIESELEGLDTNVSEEEMGNFVKEIVKEEGIELVGINPEAIARVVKEASTHEVAGNIS